MDRDAIARLRHKVNLMRSPLETKVYIIVNVIIIIKKASQDVRTRSILQTLQSQSTILLSHVTWNDMSHEQVPRLS